jgi:TolB protein
MVHPRLRTASLLALGAAALAALVALPILPVTGQPPQPQPQEQPLPEGGLVIDVDAQAQQIYRVAVPDFLGTGEHARAGTDILRTDFRVMPGYHLIDPASIRHDAAAEGLEMQTRPWAALDADAVFKARLDAQGNRVTLEMRFYRLTQGGTPALTRTYTGTTADIRRFVHDFANESLRTLTGTPGPFGTKLAFARRHAPGRKDVYCAQMDGYGFRRMSSGEGIAMLPTFGEGSIWYTVMTPTGMFITHARAREREIIAGNGINMAPSICDGRIYFTSSRDGQPEIYSSNPEGRDIRRLTNDPAMDLSPTCGPQNKLAFVSTRHGGPQIFMMNRDGSDVRRVTFRGSHNQTPAFCQQEGRLLIAFTGRDEGYALDVFTVDANSQNYTRLTQGQGQNKDPAFSPDCRVVAFASNRRSAPGLYLAGPGGGHQTRVVENEVETIRWGPQVPPIQAR